MPTSSAPRARRERRRRVPGSYEVSQETNTDQGNDRARRSHRDPASRPARKSSERDSADVQHAGRDHKAHGIRDGVRPNGKFCAMRVAVKDGERSNQNGRNPKRRPCRESHHRAERNGRYGDAGFNARQRHPEDPERSAKGHHQRKYHWKGQIAGTPRNAPHSPTATMATKWSSPLIGCLKPPTKSMPTPFSE